MNLYKVTWEVKSMIDDVIETRLLLADSHIDVAERYDFAQTISLVYKDVEILKQKKQPKTHKEYLEELRVNDPITYSELTSDPTGSGNDELSEAQLSLVYMLFAFAFGVFIGWLII